MAGKQTPDGKKVHLFPPPSKDFDPFAATDKDLMRHGLPLRPRPGTLVPAVRHLEWHRHEVFKSEPLSA